MTRTKPKGSKPETPAPEPSTPEPVSPATVAADAEVQPLVSTDVQPVGEKAQPNPAPENVVGAPIVEVKAEVAFGGEAGDLPDDGDAEATRAAAAAVAAGDVIDEESVTVVYTGAKGEDRRSLNHSGTITVIVPDSAKGSKPDYESLITTGRTYVLNRNQPRTVAKEHAKWLTGHPAYEISVKKTD